MALGYPTIDRTTNFLAALGAADTGLVHLARMDLHRNHVSDDRGGLISSARQQVPVDGSYAGPAGRWTKELGVRWISSRRFLPGSRASYDP